MSSSAKRRQTIAKRNREQAVKERRTKKREKKEAKKLAAAEGTSPEAGVDRVEPDPVGPYAAMLARLELSAEEAELLTDDEIMLRADEMGMSRLTAERILALEREREDGARPQA